MPRLFVGTFLPENQQSELAGIKEKNQELQEKWEQRVSFVGRGNFHITWLFLGEIEKKRIPRLSKELAILVNRVDRKDFAPGPLSIKYDKLELWPSPQIARLGVITSHVVAKEIRLLANSICTGLEPFIERVGKNHKQKDFKPHITVMRLRGAGKRQTNHSRIFDVGEMHGFEQLLPFVQSLDHVSLIESDLRSGRPDYTSLTDIKL